MYSFCSICLNQAQTTWSAAATDSIFMTDLTGDVELGNKGMERKFIYGQM